MPTDAAHTTSFVWKRCTEMGTVRLPMHADGTIIFYRACRRMVATERLIAARLSRLRGVLGWQVEDGEVVRG